MISRRIAVALSLSIATFAAAPGVNAQSGRNGSRYEAQLADYAAADSAGKLHFLQSLLTRSEYACSVTMSPRDLERQRMRNRAILERAAAGRELSDGGLRELLAEVDANQQRAIDKLRRDYAYSTAQAFHNNRAEFDRWTTAWEKIERRYREEGRPADWQARMIDWLALAAARQAQFTIAQARPAGPRMDQNPLLSTIPTRRGPNIRHAELEARIAGYNLAVARLLSDLNTRDQWTVEELGQTAAELADLATARHDLGLYWELLSPQVQARMSPLRPLDDVISLLAGRTSERRRQLEITNTSSSPRIAWEMRRLDEVSRRLATLAAPRS